MRSVSAGSAAASAAGKRCTPGWRTSSISMVTVGSPPCRKIAGRWATGCTRSGRSASKGGWIGSGSPGSTRSASLGIFGASNGTRCSRPLRIIAARMGTATFHRPGRTIASWATGSWCSGRPTRRAGLTASRSSGCRQSAFASASSAIGSWRPIPRSLARRRGPRSGVRLDYCGVDGTSSPPLRVLRVIDLVGIKLDRPVHQQRIHSTRMVAAGSDG